MHFHLNEATSELYVTEASWDIETDEHGFPAATDRELGRLWGLLFVQAQCDGASRMQLYYGTERMIYTINDADYEMVPPPTPLNVDMCRLLARASKLRLGVPGKLEITFADLALKLEISHENSGEKTCHLEVRGFTGTPCKFDYGSPKAQTIPLS